MKLEFTLENMRKMYPELTDAYLDELKKWGEQHGVYNIPPEQLALFAHSCIFDKEASKKCMSAYYRLRTNIPEFFGNRDLRIDAMQTALKVARFAILPVPDPQGNIIIFNRLADFRAELYVPNDGIKLMNMILDASIYTNGCSPGYVFITDATGIGFGHMMKMSMSSMRKHMEYVQEALPIRIKAMHVLNTVWIMNKLLAIVKPFIKNELLDLMHLHTGDVSNIYQYVPIECLPSDYGGKLESVDQLHEKLCRRLEELRDYYEEEEKEFRSWHPMVLNESS